VEEKFRCVRAGLRPFKNESGQAGRKHLLELLKNDERLPQKQDEPFV
jgi:hypothetical protein